MRPWCGWGDILFWCRASLLSGAQTEQLILSELVQSFSILAHLWAPAEPGQSSGPPSCRFVPVHRTIPFWERPALPKTITALPPSHLSHTRLLNTDAATPMFNPSTFTVRCKHTHKPKGSVHVYAAVPVNTHTQAQILLPFYLHKQTLHMHINFSSSGSSKHTHAKWIPIPPADWEKSKHGMTQLTSVFYFFLAPSGEFVRQSSQTDEETLQLLNRSFIRVYWAL